MSFTNLLKLSSFVTLSFFAAHTVAQDVKSADTSRKVASTVNFGYGSQAQNSLTGAVTKVTSENFNQGAVFNPAGQLAGKVAGLSVTQPGGDPNQVASMSIRGQASLLANSSPLFVVDGVILDNATQFQNIPPDEIASYTVLKDAASCAIYGARGANGVIIVTTMKGSTGSPVVSYSGLVGEAKQSKYYDLLTAGQYRQTISSLYPSSTSALDKGANTDWQKAIGRTALQHQNSLSVSGGSNMITYLAGVDYQNQQGIIQNNGKEELGLRFNTGLKAFANRLDAKVGIQYVNTTSKFADYRVFGLVPNAPPTYPIRNPDGSYYAFSDFNESNPVELLNGETLGDKEHLTLINGSADYSITRGLKFGIFGSIDFNGIESNGNIPTFPIENNVAEFTQSNDDTHHYDANIHLSYDKTFGKSTLILLAAYEYNKYSDDFNYNNSPTGNSGFVKTGYKLNSLITRAAYSYDDRFFATAILREDGPSLTKAEQHSFFPSISAAYNLKKDVFFGTDWLSEIKLKAGYGATGNMLDQSGNPLFQWEKSHGTDIGLDFSLFKGKWSGAIDYFNNETKNLLVPYILPSPPFVPGTVLLNSGSLTNKGLELSLSGQIISGNQLSWKIYGQITFAQTEVNDLSGQYILNGQIVNSSASQLPFGYAEGRGLSSSPISYIKPGYSPFVFYLPHFTGVNTAGHQMFDGVSADPSDPGGNASPPAHYIDPAPKFNYGITNSFDYGNWNLTFALRGVYGQKIFDNTLLNIQTITRLPGNNVTREALTNGIKDAPVASDLWLEGASYLRMDNVTLGYSFKNVSFAKVLRVYFAANNLFIITSYKGLDPEVRTQVGYSNPNVLFDANVNGSMNQPYIDGNYGGQGYYPMARVFSLGLNITLK
jgi:iron complex outermembrane receptor protein